MATGSGLLDRARKHIGEEYVNLRVPKDDPNWSGPWDCAEFMSWLVYQEAGILYGCTDNNAAPKLADAYTGAWKRDSLAIGKRVTVAEAASTVGAFLLRYPPVPGEMGHIALSDGQGGTVEAKGRKFGVVADTVQGRRWDTGVLVPGITYGTQAAPIAVSGPATLYAIDAPNMSPDKVSEIQRALTALGFDPGPVTGTFARMTLDAVAAFQKQAGLVVDGEVGSATAGALGIDLIGPVLKALPAIAGGGTMGPLIAIATAVLPEIIKAIAGDKSGAVQNNVAKAVTDAAGTTDPVAAQQAIKTNQAAAMALQVRLAEIALDQEKARQQAQADLIKAQMDREVKQIQADVQNTADARATALKAAALGGPMSWGAPLVSLVVTVGFFLILVLILFFGKDLESKNANVVQIINITVGALAAAFATVVNFWLGSSEGSRRKDVATASLQADQVQQTKELIKTQGATAEAARQAAVSAQAAKAPPAAVRRSNFQNCVDIVLQHEGGFSNDPADPGGATQFGITLATLRAFRGDDGLDAGDVQKLDKTEACEIYRTKYWNVLRCDDLPPGIDLVVFDFGVNAGPSRSAKFLQKIVGAETDGSVGPATVAATKVADPRDVIAKFSAQRLEYYRGLSTWPRFKNGWTNRTEDVEQAALAMARTSGPVA